MKVHAALIVGITLVSASSAIGQKNFPDIPEHHWVFEDLSQIAKGGLYDHAAFRMRFPLTRLSTRPTSRLQIAEAVIFFCQSAIGLADKEETLLSQIGRFPNDPASVNSLRLARLDQSRFRAAGSIDQPLAALFKEFATDVRDLGKNPSDLQRSATNATYRLAHLLIPIPGSALVQFKDVPPGHWAADSVLALRRLGVLQGYPDGRSSSPRSYDARKASDPR